MIRLICRSCLRLWSAEGPEHRSACPYCGGALASHHDTDGAAQLHPRA